MAIAIRPADLQKDKAALIAAQSAYLTPAADEARYDWLYLNNPLGPAKAWMAVETATGKTIGTSAAFPRQARVEGRDLAGWVLGDFCLCENYRSLGPALQLQRATLAAIADSQEFCYDFPSRQLSALYQRLGIAPAARMVRMIKPLRLERKFERLSSKNTARVLGFLATAVLRLRDIAIGSTKTWEFELHQGRCGVEFTRLYLQALPLSQRIEIVRTAEYLNWRYLSHPTVKHQILTARKKGELHGYLVFNTGEDGKTYIHDWCTGDNPRVLAVLIRDLCRRLRRDRFRTLTAFVMDSDPRRRLLAAMGFWSRESSPVMVHWQEADAAPDNWLLVHGDRDM